MYTCLRGEQDGVKKLRLFPKIQDNKIVELILAYEREYENISFCERQKVKLKKFHHEKIHDLFIGIIISK